MLTSWIKEIVTLLMTLTPVMTVEPPVEYTYQLPPVQHQGLASFYGAGEKGMHGNITATGEAFRPKDQTCASRYLPLHMIVIVEDVNSGRWTYCRVNDRGPYGAKLYDRAGGGWAAMFRRKGGYLIKRREGGQWLAGEWFKRRPGRYRGVMDMSYGTAKALGIDLDKGLNEIRVRYWVRSKHSGYSPIRVPVVTYTAQCDALARVCGESNL